MEAANKLTHRDPSSKHLLKVKELAEKEGVSEEIKKEIDRVIELIVVSHNLKLVRTLLNYRILGTSIAAIFFQMIIIYLRWTSCLISFVWDQSTCQERVESDKIQNEKFLPTVGLETHNPEI